jgi:hypothetical protein
MRKLSSDYKVSYVLRNPDLDIEAEGNNSACYRDIYHLDSITEDFKLTLSDFLCEETLIYHKEYIKRISKIFGLTVEYENKNRIHVVGFKNLTIMKVFLAMFRILFEIYSAYPKTLEEDYKKETISFMKDFCKCKRKGPSRDQLERFCYFYNLNGIYGGGGHGLTSSRGDKVALLKKSDIEKRSKKRGVLDFFDIK